MLGFNSLASAPLGSVFAGAVSQRYITLTLVDSAGSPMANLSNLKWAIFDGVTPINLSAPTDFGSNGSTDALGVLNLDIGATGVQIGGVGSFLVSTTDGTVEQNPSAKTFFGPIVVN
jgi:hypothetical protein